MALTMFMFIVSLLAALLSALSGGGSGLLMVPAWIFLGYPLPTALMAVQVNAFFWTPVAARNYLKTAKIDRALLFALMLFGVGGVYLGSAVVLNYDAAILQRIVGLIILALVLVLAGQPDLGVVEKAPTLGRFATGLGAFPLGFYEAFFGAGNGIFTSLLLSRSRGFSLTTSLGYYYILASVWCFLSALFYFRNGYADFRLIVPSTIGSIIGAYIGSAIGQRRGSAFVKLIFTTVGTALGIKLVLGF